MHEPAQEWKKDNASSLKEILGKWLFFIYAIVYVGFVAINVLSPKFMSVDIGSLNMAIVYGFGLIIFAMLLAFAFNHVSSHAEDLLNTDNEEEEEAK